MLNLFLTLALGYGLIGQGAFYSHMVFNSHDRILPHVITLIFGLALYSCVLKTSFKREPTPPGIWIGFIILAILVTLLGMAAAHFPLGGWDAWSCWNLKAKFMYLGQDRWKDMFDPHLWRSNTQYPLLLPAINVWFWDLIGRADAAVPMLNSIIFTVLTAGILLFGLIRFYCPVLPAALLTGAIFSTPFILTLAISQYSDILLGLYLLCAFVCLASDEMVLCGIFLGLLSFTKTEGMVSACILGLIILLKYPKDRLRFLVAFILAAMPTLIFQFIMAPRNEAFINGWVSTAKHSNLPRLLTILVYMPMEAASAKWNGLWLISLGALLVFWKKAWRDSLLVFPMFFLLFLTVLISYYHINTFFEITWWLQTTLNRILFALLPSFMLWLVLSFL